MSTGNTMSLRSKNIDGGWAWVILTCSSCSFFLNGFLCYSMGIITEAMLEVFEGDLTLTSAVGSAVVGGQCCSGPLVGLISKSIGCRPCAVLGGIIAATGFIGASVSRNLYTVLIFCAFTGIGAGLPLTSCSIMIGRYFNRLLPVASGIAVTGSGIGMFVGPPFVRYLLDQYNLHGCFLIMAGILSHFCVVGSLLRPLPKSGNIHKTVIKRQKSIFSNVLFSGGLLWKKIKTCDGCSLSLCKNVGFMIYLGSVYSWAVAESVCILHLANYCILQGTSKIDAALLFTAMGISCIVSRLLTGFAANDKEVENLTIVVGQLGAASIFTGLFPLYSRTYGGQMTYAVALGIYTSGMYSLYTPIIVQLVGLEGLPIGLGLVNCVIGLGYLTGSPVAGAIVDYGASYRESFLFAGCMYLLASLSAMITPLAHARKDGEVIPGLTSKPDLTISLDDIPECNSDENSQSDEHNIQSEIQVDNTCELQPLK